MYNQLGTYTAIAGVIVSILGHFGIDTTVDAIAQIIGAIVLVIGIIKQAKDHKRLATVTGHR